MRRYSVIFLLGTVVCIQAWAADEFDGIKCGADIPKAMTAKHESNERVVVLEKLHSNLGLKDLGGIEISDRLFLISWRICGNEYAELINTEKHLVRDLLLMPPHSLHCPESLVERCQVSGSILPDAVIAILDNSQGDRPKGYLEQIALPAKVAWKIDERQERFVPMPTKGLSCAVSGSSEDVKQ
jgi:hypothetical protein